MKKRISIIVPIYNVEKYILKCLESVSVQTFKGELECILVDDCGTDDSIAIAQDFISAYQGPIAFKIIHHKNNRGLSAARNTGIKEAKSDWLYFLDSDDWIEPDCIDSLYAFVEKYPDVQMVQAGANVIGNGYKWMDFTDKKLPEYSNNPQWISKVLLQRFTLNMTAWNKLIRKNFVDENNLLFAEGYIHEDEIYNVDLARTLCRIAVCYRNTYDYRIRPNSIVTKTLNIRHRLSVLKNVWQLQMAKSDYRISYDVALMIWKQFHVDFYDRPREVSTRVLLPLVKKLKFIRGTILVCYILLFHIKGIRRINRSFVRYMQITNIENPLISEGAQRRVSILHNNNSNS